MNKDDSWTRPELERDTPLQQWGAQGSATRTKSTQKQSPNMNGAAKGASLGYELAEDQMNEGKEYAQKHEIPGAATDMFGLGGFGAMQPDAFYALSERLMRDAMLWFQFIVSSARKAPAFGAPQAAQASTAAASTGFISKVSSQQPVEVTFTPHTGAEDRPLGVHELRAVDPDFPGIADVQVEYLDGQWRVSIEIAKKQPVGLYTGIVFDREEGSIRGSLAVSVMKR